MKELKLDKGKRGLVIVAHPDDETIWMGGTILMHPDVKWTIFSLCRASDADREPKFRRVCALYGAESIMTDLEDEDIMSVKQSVPVIKNLIKRELKDKRYGYVFTHGSNAEYGHIRHEGVHLAVKDLVKEEILKPEAVFYFNYEKDGSGDKPKMALREDSDFKLDLPEEIMREKKRIVAEVHGYAWDGIDVGLCTNPEGFLAKFIK